MTQLHNSMKAPKIQLRNGAVKGTVIERSGVQINIFNDIPFAKCDRFEKPQPYGAWDGLWDGTVKTRRCPASRDTDAFYNSMSATIRPLFADYTDSTKFVESEESLHLSVVCPNTAGKKPIMVWIHGGGWLNGAVSDYDYSVLAATGDVIVVAITYRAGFIKLS